MIKNFISDLRREFKGYNVSKFTGDLMAGLTVCAVALPLALAFGVSSGATAAAGIVTAIIAGIVIGFFSGASFQISGPTGAMSAVLISIVAKEGIQGMLVACFAAGVLLLLSGVLKLGRLISFIPSPVVMGFTSGIAVVIAAGQIDNFFGTHSEGLSIIEKIASYGKLGFKPSLNAVIIGAIVIAVMIVWPKKWNARVPSSLVGLIVATVVSVVCGMDDLAVVGDIPKTLLLDDRLSFGSLSVDMLTGLASPIITITALAMIESLMCGASASRMKNEPFDANRELVAQGIGNIVIPILGGVPATAAIARTSVAIKSGEQTRLCGIFHSLFLLASMFLLGGVMAMLPMSALAGILMMTAWRMNEWNEIKYIFRNRFKGAISQFLITMVATVVFDLMVAIVIGVIYSAILFMVSSSKINVSFSEFDSARAGVKNVENSGKVQVAYVTGSLFFGATDSFCRKFEELPECDRVIISMRGVSGVDVSGAKAMAELCEDLAKSGIGVSFCGVQDNVKQYLDRAGVVSSVGEENFYWSADKAFMSICATSVPEVNN